MRGPPSAFTTLGLPPDADRAAIEAAYRRLIKLHHPDRNGGDGQRAAEINRAYFELCRQPQPQPAHIIEPPPPARVRRRSAVHRRRGQGGQGGQGGRGWAVLATVGAAALLIEGEQLERLDALFAQHVFDWRPVAAAPSRGAPARVAAMRSPMSEAAIAAAVREAVSLSKRGSGEVLVQQSQECHRQLREEPSLLLLDRCTAFDDAVAALSEGERSAEGGRFSASSLTARHTTAASLLSSDYLAIEERLDRIRARVDLMLAPPEPPPTRPRPAEVARYSGAAEVDAAAPAAAPPAAAGAAGAEAEGADLPSGLSEGAVAEPPSDQRKLPDASNLST